MAVIPFAAAVAVLLSLGYFFTSLVWPENLNRRLILIFGPAAGAGICSIIFVTFRRPMFTVEAALLAASAAAWFYRRKRKPASTGASADARIPAAWLLPACAAGMAISYWIVLVERTPHGDWDAMAIWNSHARYLYRAGAAWPSGIRNTFHADYPLLGPSLTARLWRYLGEESQDAAGAQTAIFAVAVAAILAGTLAAMGRTRQAVLFGLILLTTPFFLEYSVSQSADVTLSLFILATMALLSLQHAGLLVLAGFMAGCAGWTKNEGLLFIALTAAALLAPVIRRRRETLTRAAFFAIGLAAPLTLTIWFKLAVAPAGDIVQRRSRDELIEKLLDPARYATVAAQFPAAFASFGNWLIHPALLVLLFLAVQGMDRSMLRSRGWLQSAFIWTAMVLGYAAVYVITPMKIDWHIQTSATRLWLQLWPSLLLLAGLASNPE